MAPRKAKPRVAAGLRQGASQTSDPRSVTELRPVVFGGPRWRRAADLMTIGDYVEDYLAIRRPRGSYRVPLPEDRIGGRAG